MYNTLACYMLNDEIGSTNIKSTNHFENVTKKWNYSATFSVLPKLNKYNERTLGIVYE